MTVGVVTGAACRGRARQGRKAPAPSAGALLCRRRIEAASRPLAGWYVVGTSSFRIPDPRP